MFFAPPDRQRGAIGLMAAGTLLLALIFTFLAVDSGRLFLEKRRLQSVVDMAALAAANGTGTCSGSGTSASSLATANATLNGFTVGTGKTLTTTCGTVATNASGIRVYTVNATSNQAVQVTGTNAVATSLAGGVWALFSGSLPNTTTTLTAVATARSTQPLAQLSIQTTVLDASLLNSTLSALCGCSINLTAVGWQGLASANVNLLSYLNQLAVNVGVSAGQYNQLVNTNVTISQLLTAMASVLQTGNSAVSATLGTLSTSLNLAPSVTLGQVLALQSDITSAALNGNVNVLNLVQAFVQLANFKNAVAVTLPVNVLNLANITTKIQVIEAPQLSAVGNPALAKINPTGPNQIYVRTAQVRVLIQATLPVLSTVTAIVDSVTNLLSGLLTLLNSVLSLNLVTIVQALSCSLGATCTALDLKILDAQTLSVSLDLGTGSSYVTDYSCTATKSLTAFTRSAAATLRIGKIDATTAFASSSPPTVTPLPLIDLGTQACNKILGLGTCQTRVPFAAGGIGVMVDSSIAATSTSMTWTNPPAIGQTPAYQSLSTSSLVSSLSGALYGIQLQIYKPSSGSTLGAVVAGVGTLLSGLTNNLLPLVTNILGSLLDPLLNNLLKGLGIDLNQVTVGANLGCNATKAQLVI